MHESCNNEIRGCMTRMEVQWPRFVLILMEKRLRWRAVEADRKNEKTTAADPSIFCSTATQTQSPECPPPQSASRQNGHHGPPRLALPWRLRCGVHSTQRRHPCRGTGSTSTPSSACAYRTRMTCTAGP